MRVGIKCCKNYEYLKWIKVLEEKKGLTVNAIVILDP